MSSEQDPQLETGLYEAAELPRFDQRQAWTGQLKVDSRDQFLNVGNSEVLRISPGRKLSPINRAESEMSLIRQAVSGNAVKVPQLARIRQLSVDLRTAVDALQPPSEDLNSVNQVLKAIIESEETNRSHEIIGRAAGYIAARESLWIVTKSMEVEPGKRRPLNIAVARLIGLALGSKTDDRPAMPVVAGKNGKPGVFTRLHQGDSRTSPRVLDVLEGIRTKP